MWARIKIMTQQALRAAETIFDMADGGRCHNVPSVDVLCAVIDTAISRAKQPLVDALENCVQLGCECEKCAAALDEASTILARRYNQELDKYLDDTPTAPTLPVSPDQSRDKSTETTYCAARTSFEALYVRGLSTQEAAKKQVDFLNKAHGINVKVFRVTTVAEELSYL